MSNRPSTQSSSPASSIDRSGVKRIVQVLATGIMLGVVLFASAGRLDWPMAWGYLGIYFVGVLVNGIVLGRRNPGLIDERGRTSRDPKARIGRDRLSPRHCLSPC